MNRGILALEALIDDTMLVPDNQPPSGQVPTDIGHGLDVTDLLQMQQEATEEIGYTGDLTEHVRAADAVGELVEYLDGANEGQGLQCPEAEALTIAVEHLLRNIGFVGGVQSAALEEQSTRRAALHNKTVTMEAFMDVLARIWKRIVEMLAKAYQWLKKVFSARSIRSKVQKERIDRVQEATVEAKAKDTISPRTTPREDETFSNESLHARLAVGLHVPSGLELIRTVQNYVHQMEQLDRAFIALDNEMLKHLESAMHTVNVKGDGFQHAIGVVYRLLVTSPIQKRSKAPNDYSQGIVLFEEPLVFGNRSYYRTGATSVAQVEDGGTADDLVAKVEASFVSRGEPNHSEPMRKLSIEQVEEINKLVLGRWKAADSIRDQRAYNLERLNRLEAEARHLMTRTGSREIDRANKRATRLAKALSWYTKQRSSIDIGLYNYDEVVLNALLDYTTQSVREG